jgi:hypothetical protein
MHGWKSYHSRSESGPSFIFIIEIDNLNLMKSLSGYKQWITINYCQSFINLFVPLSTRFMLI